MTMMLPTIVVASVPAIVVAPVPTVVVAVTAVIAPPMPVAAVDLNDRSIGAVQRIGCCCGHSRRRQGWCECKSTAGKSDYQKPFHLSPSSFVVSGPEDYQVRLQCWLNSAFIDRSGIATGWWNSTAPCGWCGGPLPQWSFATGLSQRQVRAWSTMPPKAEMHWGCGRIALTLTLQSEYPTATQKE